ncbi:rho guanine nucleotide exchange factor TIAM2-like isoform X3 [Oscarella lobularis]|uniref:rho guanine nucleotide exchange factor TIAM2-like isoform X3 n=1 Tax=Oscarella lobularis TaxID=121494 RepID=UPI003313AEFA
MSGRPSATATTMGSGDVEISAFVPGRKRLKVLIDSSSCTVGDLLKTLCKRCGLNWRLYFIAFYETLDNGDPSIEVPTDLESSLTCLPLTEIEVHRKIELQYRLKRSGCKSFGFSVRVDNSEEPAHLYISEVELGYPAHLHGVIPGDEIVSVNAVDLRLVDAEQLFLVSRSSSLELELICLSTRLCPPNQPLSIVSVPEIADEDSDSEEEPVRSLVSVNSACARKSSVMRTASHVLAGLHQRSNVASLSQIERKSSIRSWSLKRLWEFERELGTAVILITSVYKTPLATRDSILNEDELALLFSGVSEFIRFQPMFTRRVQEATMNSKECEDEATVFSKALAVLLPLYKYHLEDMRLQALDCFWSAQQRRNLLRHHQPLSSFIDSQASSYDVPGLGPLLDVSIKRFGQYSQLFKNLKYEAEEFSLETLVNELTSLSTRTGCVISSLLDYKNVYHAYGDLWRKVLTREESSYSSLSLRDLKHHCTVQWISPSIAGETPKIDQLAMKCFVFSSAVVVTPRLSTLPTDFSQTPAACSRVYPRADVAAEASEDPDGLQWELRNASVGTMLIVSRNPKERNLTLHWIREVAGQSMY